MDFNVICEKESIQTRLYEDIKKSCHTPPMRFVSTLKGLHMKQITTLLTAMLVCTATGFTQPNGVGDIPLAHPDAPEIASVTIPAGEFLMGTGDTNDSDIGPQHRVWLDEYRIGKYEVTWGEYQKFIDAGGYKELKTTAPDAKHGYWSRRGVFHAEQIAWYTNESESLTAIVSPRWTTDGNGPSGLSSVGKWPPDPRDPVVGISRWEAEAFCRFVGGRLPTEAEWEKAACWAPGATQPRTYPWGDSSTIVCNASSILATVDSPTYAKDVSGYGVYGMGGNVSEFVADMYDADFYAQGPGAKQIWKSPFNFQARRLDYVDIVTNDVPKEWVVRGGNCWRSSRDNKYFKCVFRTKETMFQRHQFFGFRVAWDQTIDSSTPVVRTARIGSAVHIPAGTYVMGHSANMPSDVGAGTNENPQHSVCLKEFWIGTYEVTWYEYKKYMELGGYGVAGKTRPAWWSERGWQWRQIPPGGSSNYSDAVEKPIIMGITRPTLGYSNEPNCKPLWKGPWLEDGEWSSPPDDHPVSGLSWYEAEAYCAFVGGRLPLEAEWETAASWNPDIPGPMQFTWGNSWEFQKETQYGNWSDDWKYPGLQTSPVGMYPEGKSPLGCFDMSGNVFEWCADYYNANSYSSHSSECGGNITTPEDMKIKYIDPDHVGYTPTPYVRAIRGGGFDPGFNGMFGQRARTRTINFDGAEGFRSFTYGVRVVWDKNPEDIANAQAVRPPESIVVNQNTPAKVTGPDSISKSILVLKNEIKEEGVIDTPGREYVYRLDAPEGTWVRIDLDANDSISDKGTVSPLDAVIEVWQDDYSVPVRIYDDASDVLNSKGDRPYYLDPPAFQHVIPPEGHFSVKVRAYEWPAEGSQAEIPDGERSYYGNGYTFTLTISAVGIECCDMSDDRRVGHNDIIDFLDQYKKQDHDQNQMNLFSLEILWNDFGKCVQEK